MYSCTQSTGRNNKYILLKCDMVASLALLVLRIPLPKPLPVLLHPALDKALTFRHPAPLIRFPLPVPEDKDFHSYLI